MPKTTGQTKPESSRLSLPTMIGSPAPFPDEQDAPAEEKQRIGIRCYGVALNTQAPALEESKKNGEPRRSSP
jgi:hypothetical protein